MQAAAKRSDDAMKTATPSGLSTRHVAANSIARSGAVSNSASVSPLGKSDKTRSTLPAPSERSPAIPSPRIGFVIGSQLAADAADKSPPQRASRPTREPFSVGRLTPREWRRCRHSCIFCSRSDSVRLPGASVRRRRNRSAGTTDPRTLTRNSSGRLPLRPQGLHRRPPQLSLVVTSDAKLAQWENAVPGRSIVRSKRGRGASSLEHTCACRVNRELVALGIGRTPEQATADACSRLWRASLAAAGQPSNPDPKWSRR